MKVEANEFEEQTWSRLLFAKVVLQATTARIMKDQWK